jgi:hypothetical protein
MAHEAFALSPISARAAQSGENDYEAIREAFMETARGRWFLGEYAKRNRQADTRMVLNAVARVERMLEAAQQPPPGTRLPEILDILSNAVDQAAQAAAAAVDGMTIEERLAPIRKGARILKKISWRWREIGSDARVCDSIDSEVAAIQQSCSQLARIDIRSALTEAFELIRTRIEALAEDDFEADAPTAKTATADRETANRETEAADAATKPRAAAAASPAARQDSPVHAIKAAPASGQESRVTAIAEARTASQRAETAHTQDEAILGLLAIAIEDHCWGDAADKVHVEPARSKPKVVAEPVELAARRHVVSPRIQPEAVAAPRPQPHPSLGSTPFASEFPEPRRAVDADPSPAIRRMSLTEKIDFFS